MRRNMAILLHGLNWVLENLTRGQEASSYQVCSDKFFGYYNIMAKKMVSVNPMTSGHELFCTFVLLRSACDWTFEANAHNPPTFARWSPRVSLVCPWTANATNSNHFPATQCPHTNRQVLPVAHPSSPSAHIFGFFVCHEKHMLLRAALCNSILKLHSISRPTNEGRQPRVIFCSLQLGAA